MVTNGHAWQDDRAAPDPNVAAYVDWATKLQPGGFPNRIAWMIGSKDLNPWANLRLVANRRQNTISTAIYGCPALFR
jgi:hypothetical protein